MRRGFRPVPRRSALSAFGSALGIWFSAGGAHAEGVRLAEIRWTGLKPTFPLFRAIVSGDFGGEVEVRVATRSDPTRYRPYLAFYRLAAALGSRLVPRTEVHAVPLPELLQALRKDPVGLGLLKDEMVVLNDGTVTILVSEPVPGGREVDFVNSGEARNWRLWAEGRQAVPRDRRGLVSGYIETQILDYLAGHTGRNLVTVDAEAAASSMHLVENGGAFAARPDLAALDFVIAQLKRVSRFPRRFIERLRAFDRPAAEAALRSGAFVDWLVPTRPLVEMLDRRGAILSLIDARVAELGEPSVLALP